MKEFLFIFLIASGISSQAQTKWFGVWDGGDLRDLLSYGKTPVSDHFSDEAVFRPFTNEYIVLICDDTSTIFKYKKIVRENHLRWDQFRDFDGYQYHQPDSSRKKGIWNYRMGTERPFIDYNLGKLMFFGKRMWLMGQLKVRPIGLIH